MTCMFPYLATMFQQKEKKNINEDKGNLHKLFSSIFYGNSNFYNLKNAF